MGQHNSKKSKNFDEKLKGEKGVEDIVCVFSKGNILRMLYETDAVSFAID